MANCLDKQNHAASICSVIINIKIYNPKNYLKSKLFVTKITGKDSDYLVNELKIKINKLKNWKERVIFVKSLVKHQKWIKLPDDHAKISEIKFIFMKYDKSWTWGPFDEMKFSNPKKIIGTMKALVQLKKMISRKSYVWVSL